jgi:tripartite-type tricarboxylate transporter receptor subunit TctC
MQNARQNVSAIAAITAAIGLLASASAALAQTTDDYPNKPIKIIVAAGAGGPTDVPARLASQILTAKLGQPVVIENRPGAGGALGARVVATSPADGYTLLMGNTSTLAVIPAVSASAGYDPVKDFVPIVKITEGFQILVVHPSAPWKTVKDFVDHTRPIQASSTMRTLATAACRIWPANCSCCAAAPR